MFTCRKKKGFILPDGGRKQRTFKAPMFCHRRGIFSKTGEIEDRIKPWAAVGTWFLGPKAENGDIFRDLMTEAIDAHFSFRHGFYPCDPPYVTDELRQAESFKWSLEKMRTELQKMQLDMHKSVPFFSTRYKGHVNWDTAMPANLGYLAALLWNQNNCALEGSPVTTNYEVEAASDLCEMMGLDRDKSMGHLVAGGSVANIEAIWVARNLKYYPLGLQEALLKSKELQDARGYKIFLPQRGEDVELVSASQWELLNVDTDTIIKMPFEVAAMAGITDQAEFRSIMSNYLYECIGAQEFCLRHRLRKSPCVLLPSTYHVSFLKAVTIVGLGKESLVTVAVDDYSRMDLNDLERLMEKKLKKEIPVISVVSIMGTTEASAVDPLTEILELREKMSKKGLNFSIHADAAWGGYFACMLRQPPINHPMPTTEESGFVPELMLNTFVSRQMNALHLCDTITVDPHKSGFCPYPAGALCYRDKNLNNFLSLSSDVMYYHGDINLGDVGLEGSKPGAAAAGVLLANNVIGLHKNGYGRILAECMFTSKILYCYWVTLAEENDNFVTATTKPLPAEESVDYKKLIREKIIGKSNEELAQDRTLMKFLQEIGPDTLVPCFSVNIKGNEDVDLCNALNTAIFNDLCHQSSSESEQRIPIIVTSSMFQDHHHSSALKHFKKRLGLQTNDHAPVKYIISTCLDPWSTSMEFMDDIAAIMRNTVLCSIGTVSDPVDQHNFVSTSAVNENNEIIVCYKGNFTQTQWQYFAVAKLKFLSDQDVKNFQEAVNKAGDDPSSPLSMRSNAKRRLHDLLFDDSDEGRDSEVFDFFLPSDSTLPIMSAAMKVVGVPRYEHFDPADIEYPEFATYFMYGDPKAAYLFHIPTLSPDFLQIVNVGKVGRGKATEQEQEVLLKNGLDVELEGVSGTPKEEGGKIVDPLTESKYKMHFIGIQGEEVITEVEIVKRIWFDGAALSKK